MSEKTRSPQKRLLAAGIAVAFGAGIVGVGASWNYVTSVVDNRFEAAVVEPGAERDGALLEVRGNAITKTFDTTTNNDSVTAEWTIANIGSYDAQFAADFAPAASIDAALADNLVIFYTVDGGDEWRAGTLAEPRELTAVTGLPDVLPAGETVDVSVRVVLPNPSELLRDGVTEVDDLLTVVADWNVRYLTVDEAAV